VRSLVEACCRVWVLGTKFHSDGVRHDELCAGEDVTWVLRFAPFDRTVELVDMLRERTDLDCLEELIRGDARLVSSRPSVSSPVSLISLITHPSVSSVSLSSTTHRRSQPSSI
jgi:hypothetical protein